MRLISVGLITAALLSACASPTAPTPAAVYAANANLVSQGIPPIPQALADAVGRYNDFRGHGFVAWHPTRREMLVSHRRAGADTAQLYRLAGPMGALQPLTDSPDPVTHASYEPRQGRYIVFERASGGNEAAQLYRLSLTEAGAQPVLLSPPDERHAFHTWLPQAGQLIYSSVPLDRTASGGSRARISTTLWLMDPEHPQGRRKLAELDGGGWTPGHVSPDEGQVVLNHEVSATESQVWLLDLASGQRRQVAPSGGAPVAAAYHGAHFSADGRQLWLATDAFGEFQELARLDLTSGRIERVSAHIPWDVSGITHAKEGARVAARFNVDGRDELHVFDADTLQELPAPRLPAGSIGSALFAKGRGELAFTLNNAQGPSQVFSLAADGSVQQWTQAYAPPGIDTASFSEQQIVRWKSFDGTTISGLLTQPSARKFPGRRPVLIGIHGGPESQATVGFLGRNQYFVNELGMALIQPNVRGSSGYGKSFLAMDNGFKREDSVKDIGALLDWIATQPELDASRVLVTGGSYGGYMTLAVSTHYADRIAGAIDVVGISHFVTFLNHTESYRRDLRRVEYGDERDPAMRAHLDRISPLTNASRITKPLFVVQGRNDPRVPYTEAEQIVAKVRAKGTPVWYLRAENEGHGFQHKDNQDYQFYATILFMQETVLKR